MGRTRRSRRSSASRRRSTSNGARSRRWQSDIPNHPPSAKAGELQVKRRSPAIAWLALGFLGVMMLPMLRHVDHDVSGPRLRHDTANSVPLGLAQLVADASVIVVASHVQVSALATVVVVGPQPTSTGVVAEPTVPIITSGVVGTQVTVETVIKNSGSISPSQSIWFHILGLVPGSTSPAVQDAESAFPKLWPQGTDFLMFLDALPGTSDYYLPYGACGRLLLDGDTAACSDGARTVLPFMTGLSGEEFIEAVEDEVHSPSPTWTPLPTPTPWE